MKKKRAFTLLELIIVMSIGAILLTISTGWYITNVASANNNNNKKVDLQGGVKSSLEMIKNTLKKSTQAHLVDKNVYNPDLNIEELTNRGLDKNYSYIAIYKDPSTNQNILANIIYSKSEGKFNVIPIIALPKEDSLNRTNIEYSMEFYKNDPHFEHKLRKNILNVTVKGVAKERDASGNPINPENDKVFELSQDIYLPNINQILRSKYFVGDLSKVTAIAYDQAKIEGESKQVFVDNMTFVFIYDTSYSMRNLEGDYPIIMPDGTKKQRRELAEPAARKFIESIHQLGIKNKIRIDAYMFFFNNRVEHAIDWAGNPDFPISDKYLYPLSSLPSSYGIYKLGIGASDDDKNRALAKFALNESNYKDSTNTGEALLQGLEILNQVADQNVPNQMRFMVLLSDGEPYGGSLIGKPVYQKGKEYILDPFTRKPKLFHKTEMVDYWYDVIDEYGQWIRTEKGKRNRELTTEEIARGVEGTTLQEDVHYTFYESDLSKAMIGVQDYKRGRDEYHLRPDGKYMTWNSVKTINADSFEDTLRAKRDFDDKVRSGTWTATDLEKHEIWYNTIDSHLVERSMLYIDKVTDPSNGLNKDDSFNKAYLIGFSNRPKDKRRIGFSSSSENPPDNSMRAYLSRTSIDKYGKKQNVLTFDTDSATSLETAFENITADIGSVMGVFDGPAELRK